MKIITRIYKKITKWRLTPIRVFCFHHVSDAYDASYMWEGDWINTDLLKEMIATMQKKGYVFISLQEAHNKLKNDNFRFQKYVVLTADDGFKSLLNILPWLEENQIPITLFVNPKYMLEGGIGENVLSILEKTHGTITNEDLYMSQKDIQSLNPHLVTFAYHGYAHLMEQIIDEDEFVKNVEQCNVALIKNYPNVIPFYAHTYGQTQRQYDIILRQLGLIPVYVSGNRNYNNITYIDRELISNERIQSGKVHV